MNRVFINCDIFSEDFFIDLSLKNRLLWIYMFINSDNSGVNKFHQKRLSRDLGFEIKKSDFLEFGDRVKWLDQDNYYIVDIFLIQQNRNNSIEKFLISGNGVDKAIRKKLISYSILNADLSFNKNRLIDTKDILNGLLDFSNDEKPTENIEQVEEIQPVKKVAEILSDDDFRRIVEAKKSSFEGIKSPKLASDVF